MLSMYVIFMMCVRVKVCFFFKQKTAYEMRISDWSSDVCSSDLIQKLEAKRAEEDKKRDGITVSQDLLDYSEVYLLRKLIDKNWDAVKPVLDDKARTDRKSVV